MRPLLVAVSFLLLAVFSFAQSGNGNIAGTISSAERPTIADALIEGKNMETGMVYRSTSSPTGNYTLSQLPPGRYELSVSAFAFDPYRQRDIAVQAGQTSRIDIALGYSGSLGTLGDDHAAFAAVLRKRGEPPAGPVPHTSDGKPDLSGIWGTEPVDPGTSDQPEMLPWAQAVFKEWRDNNFKDLPSSRCLPGGPGLLGQLFLNKIVQTSDLLVIMNEGDIPGYRQVFVDGRGHSQDLEKTWTGHSIGEWEGDTLIVDTIGLNNKTWLAMGPHTEMLHITTRLRRFDSGHLEVETTFDDPETYVKPWKTKKIFLLVKDQDIQEYICNENNQYPQNVTGK